MKSYLGYFLASLLLFLFSLISSNAERVTFTEIHYAPKNEMPEYIEIFNNSGSAVDFACWEFTDGITYKFPDFSASSPQKHLCVLSREL